MKVSKELNWCRYKSLTPNNLSFNNPKHFEKYCEEYYKGLCLFDNKKCKVIKYIKKDYNER